jgi:hypothetical protein
MIAVAIMAQEFQVLEVVLLSRESTAPTHSAQLLVVVTFATGNWMLPVPPPTSTLM